MVLKVYKNSTLVNNTVYILDIDKNGKYKGLCATRVLKKGYWLLPTFFSIDTSSELV